MDTRQFMLLVVLVLMLLGAVWFMVEKNPAPELTAIGGQKDANGCLTGAGYSWCEAKRSCIRQWETYCTATPPKTALFTCDEGKTINATFYPGDDKFADLVMSNDMKVSLPRAMSGSGARYAKADESLVFWNKGDTAFFTVNGTTTFSNCITKAQ